MKTINLSSYSVQLGCVKSSLSQYLGTTNFTSINVIVDDNTQEHCLPLIEKMLPGFSTIRIDPGESHKNLVTCQKIWAALSNNKVDRKGLVINLGGGVIGDMGGFCAATYMRGIDFIHIPTTLLSQVDASVGGKLGIDFQGLKNFVGLFQNPRSVLVDPTFLETLPYEELRSGYAEMIKHALIQDESIWQRFLTTSQWSQLAWRDEIFQSIEIKKNIVSSDPEEQGLRKILNFGHTIGHAVETLSFERPKPFLHGEAIAIGMAAETQLSITYCGLDQNSADTILSYLRMVYPDLNLNILKHQDEIIEILSSDKKNKGGKFLFSLLEQIGVCTFDVTVEPEDLRKCLDTLCENWR